MPYSACGCVPDPHNNSVHHADRFVSEVSHKNSTSRTVNNFHPDLTLLVSEEGGAWRPSEHNPAGGDPSSEAAEQSVMTSEVKAERKYHIGEKAPLQPTHDLWVSPQAARSQRHAKDDRREEAFTDRRVGSGAYCPYWGISMIPAFGWVRSFWYPQTLTHVAKVLRRLCGYGTRQCMGRWWLWGRVRRRVRRRVWRGLWRRRSGALVFGYFGIQFGTSIEVIYGHCVQPSQWFTWTRNIMTIFGICSGGVRPSKAKLNRVT